MIRFYALERSFWLQCGRWVLGGQDCQWGDKLGDDDGLV